MSEKEAFDMGGTDAPENKEKEFVKPGYRKLTVKSFDYTKEDEGKTPLILMKAEGVGESGDPVEFTERFYMSGKLNKEKKMSSVIRLQELYKGLTDKEKMTIQPSLYRYTKENTDGSKTTFAIPNPDELCKYLAQTCVGKTAIFKVGGEDNDGKVFAKLTYSGFLYYTDKTGNLVKYKKEGEFSESEAKFAIQKKKGENAPAHGNGIATPSQLDEL